MAQWPPLNTLLTTGNSDCNATRGLSCSAFYSSQLENATATFTPSNITITVVRLRQSGKPNQKDG